MCKYVLVKNVPSMSYNYMVSFMVSSWAFWKNGPQSCHRITSYTTIIACNKTLYLSVHTHQWYEERSAMKTLTSPYVLGLWHMTWSVLSIHLLFYWGQIKISVVNSQEKLTNVSSLLKPCYFQYVNTISLQLTMLLESVSKCLNN